MNVKERFLNYIAFHTTSDEASENLPSTSRQRVFGEYLVKELTQIGMQEAQIDEYGYVYATLPASNEYKSAEPLGLIAHMDTSPDVSGKDVSPSIVHYTGGDIPLSGGAVITESKFPFLKDYIGQDLIVTDGKTLLGADDKAGIAEIVSACAYFAENPKQPHRAIAVCFTPDEEIGRGADNFCKEKFAAKTAYTVDGGRIGEIEYENFNAASAVLTVHGINIHPGSAKNKMKNAVLLASEWITHLPAAETPAHTEGYEGFYHVSDLNADESLATVQMIVRDHDRENFERRKTFLQNLTGYMNSVYGADTFDLSVHDTYYNMKEKILPHMELISHAENAMRAVGITPKHSPIRGGTDGARLSYEGLPCPNLSTGGENFHSVHEFVSVQSMEKMVAVLLELAKPN